MATLLLWLEGPMQSWGTASRFTDRDSGREPSKSGVIGLLAAALGIDREAWEGTDLPTLSGLLFGVRHDRAGVPAVDYQTAGAGYAPDGHMMKADGKKSPQGVLSRREYLSGAAFLAGLQSEDRGLLQRCHDALANPRWPLSLGRRSYVPSEPVWLKDGLVDWPLLDALGRHPDTKGRSAAEPEIRVSYDHPEGKDEGRMCMDVPLAAFSERHFGARFVLSWFVDEKGRVVPEGADGFGEGAREAEA